MGILRSVQQLEEEFAEILGVRFEASLLQREAATELLKALSGLTPIGKKERRYALFASINSKFKLNADGFQRFLTYAANRGVTFNYHEKIEISSCFDCCDAKRLSAALESAKVDHGLGQDLLAHFAPLSSHDTLKKLHAELKQPTLTRKDSKPRDWSEEILASLFAAFVYGYFPERAVHEVFDKPKEGRAYEPDFWLHLHHNMPELFSRAQALVVFAVTTDAQKNHSRYDDLRDFVLKQVASVHQTLANHGVLALIIDDIGAGGRKWQLFGDIVLYAEKHLSTNVRQAYFRSEDIASSTAAYVPELDVRKADFGTVNAGFHYRDCFVLGDGKGQRLLLLLQKNQADETLIPCPACRSHNVQGNSYSSLGVKSWECNNPLCIDRSKFNRGKRYSFFQLLKQRAIQEPDNQIPVEAVRAWSRDVQPERDDEAILSMLVRHFSLAGDTVQIANLAGVPKSFLGRNIVSKDVAEPKEKPQGLIAPQDFAKSAYFARYIYERKAPTHYPTAEHTVESVKVLRGDAFEVLSGLEPESMDGAVTSPPYYNAREYSQWANIYTYLYDMYNINRQVFRALRPGAYYLFNIFDYFDNENNVSLSAMGEKRMILGAYIVDLFTRIGFECKGNVVWDKGDIEGKRGFNNGNFSPYYQAPFNCWEHVFVFRKPGLAKEICFPSLLEQKPVFKIINGENRHGHTAPYPVAIPDLLVRELPKGAVVLDPFAGSMTTGIAAMRRGLRAVCIEKDETYVQLGIGKLQDSRRQPVLI